VIGHAIAGLRMVGGESSIFGSMKAKQGAKTVPVGDPPARDRLCGGGSGDAESTLGIDLWLAAICPCW